YIIFGGLFIKTKDMALFYSYDEP
ncbi:hypothetical protein, partial [Plasmodium yoelii yoelii]